MLISDSASSIAAITTGFCEFWVAVICKDMRIPSTMAFKRPPPSPLNAGPRHSGLLISKRTIKFAFSSTLSP
jgi:hypothetical protein